MRVFDCKQLQVENQEAADKRIPILLDTASAIRWVSAEPLLGEIDIVPYMGDRTIKCKCGFKQDENWIFGASPGAEVCMECGNKITTYPSLDWIVCGGESGISNARPMHPDWAYSVLKQCEETNTPFFFKQWGEWTHPGINGFGTHSGKVAFIDSYGNFLDTPTEDENADCLPIKRVGKKISGKMIGGRLYVEYPFDQQIKNDE
ncbi:DUF5131 family protein [Methylomonas sp. AM2-LC]|uniref:DUF5131 family protein n=1 Tax=Methylomonas sp. AM2-LC TaxID=3153301 RepID=UPI003263911B